MADQGKSKKALATAALAAAMAAPAVAGDVSHMPKNAERCEVVQVSKGYGLSIRDKGNHEIGHSGVLKHLGAPGGHKGYMLFEGAERDQKSNTVVAGGHYQLMVKTSTGEAACLLNNAKAAGNPADSFKAGVKTHPAGKIEDGMKPINVLERLNLGSQPATPAKQQVKYPEFGLHQS